MRDTTNATTAAPATTTSAFRVNRGRAWFQTTSVVFVTTTALVCAAFACGRAKPPPQPPMELDAGVPEPVVVLPPPEVPDAAPPEDAAVHSKPFALCSVNGGARADAQCLEWRGCQNGMDQTFTGKRVRHCAVTTEACGDAEKDLTSLADKLKDKLALDGGTRACANRNYLKKEIRTDEGRVTVCPADKDDAALSALWKRLVATCKEPIHE
jgi:hypothetical protein